MSKTITLDGVEYELVPVYDIEGFHDYKGVLKGYLLKPTEVTNQSLSLT